MPVFSPRSAAVEADAQREGEKLEEFIAIDRAHRAQVVVRRGDDLVDGRLGEEELKKHLFSLVVRLHEVELLVRVQISCAEVERRSDCRERLAKRLQRAAFAPRRHFRCGLSRLGRRCAGGLWHSRSCGSGRRLAGTSTLAQDGAEQVPIAGATPNRKWKIRHLLVGTSLLT